MILIEAVTPSEYKQAGLGLTIIYGYHQTPYGEAFIALGARGICKFCFIEAEARQDSLKELQQEWPYAIIKEDNKQTAAIVEMIFSRPHSESSAPSLLSLWVRGTDFQLKVWNTLLNIQPGQVTSYSEIAKAIGKPKAARAVGTAIGSNPVGFIIPCHRVIRQTGKLGGYRWGETRKRAMLIKEAAIKS